MWERDRLGTYKAGSGKMMPCDVEATMMEFETAKGTEKLVVLRPHWHRSPHCAKWKK